MGEMQGESHINIFEQQLSLLSEDQIEDMAVQAAIELPPDEEEVEAIRANITKLESQGLTTTAGFYRRLLEQRERQEG